MIATKLLLPLGLAFIMFAMGLTLLWGDFRRVFEAPKAMAIGLVCQLLLLPAAAFGLLFLWPLQPEFAVGVMILAAAPGGITSNMLTHLARGDSALSISLTAISSLAGVVTVPLVVNFALMHFSSAESMTDLPVGRMILGVLLVSTLPLILGMAINHLRPAIAEKIEKVARPMSIGVFALIVLWAFASQWRVMMENIALIGPTIIALNVIILVGGFWLAGTQGLHRRQAIAIAMEGGLQNGALGIFVAMTLLGNAAMMVPSITYALVMNVSAALFILAVLARRAPSYR